MLNPFPPFDSGNVDATDLVLLANYLVGNTPTLQCVSLADNNQDGTLNAVDLSILANFLAGNVATLPCPTCR
ncbi:MAG: dockerin type I repeat-containing protein [Acidobacteria bacterium]|nr:dockerin type I repeat-containing protein [Acidobacteriota bacterium]